MSYAEYFPPHLSNVPVPPGATIDPASVEWSEMWPGSGYTRLVRWASFETAQATASIEGLQQPDGSFTRSIVLYNDGDPDLTAAEARQIAATLIEVANVFEHLR